MSIEFEMAKAIDQVQRMIAAAADAPETDPRSLAVALTQFETAFLWYCSAVGGEPVFNGQ